MLRRRKGAFLMAQWVKKLRIIQETQMWFDHWFGKIPWRRKWQPTPVFVPRDSHGQRSLVGYRPWGHKELDMTEQLSMEGNIPFGWNLRKGSMAREAFNLGSIEQAVSVMSLNSHTVKCLHPVSSWHPSQRQVCELPALSPVPSAGNLNTHGWHCRALSPSGVGIHLNQRLKAAWHLWTSIKNTCWMKVQACSGH